MGYDLTVSLPLFRSLCMYGIHSDLPLQALLLLVGFTGVANFILCPFERSTE